MFVSNEYICILNVRMHVCVCVYFFMLAWISNYIINENYETLFQQTSHSSVCWHNLFFFSFFFLSCFEHVIVGPLNPAQHFFPSSLNLTSLKISKQNWVSANFNRLCRKFLCRNYDFGNCWLIGFASVLIYLIGERWEILNWLIRAQLNWNSFSAFYGDNTYNTNSFRHGAYLHNVHSRRPEFIST